MSKLAIGSGEGTFVAKQPDGTYKVFERQRDMCQELVDKPLARGLRENEVKSKFPNAKRIGR